MSASRALARKVGCQNCQWRTLHTFAAFAGLSIGPVHAIAPTLRASARPFATTRVRRQDKVQDDRLLQSKVDPTDSEILTEIVSSQDVDDVVDEPVSSQATSAPQDPSIPWYLQDQNARLADNGHVSHQQLPDLPVDSPEKLKTMVEHLFTDIGLDDLRILDLRQMDPPPALGSNLIMVLGTARSDRHLHVSADRFCRWLRSAYKLRPFADGLLGRNELKIRLRRKAKRAKLLGSKGPLEPDADDGIRTSWVCVNVGSIEETTHEQSQETEREGIIGFGSGDHGVHLVVQMMIEEKREELNLEKLWLDALARQERQDLRAQQALDATQISQEEASQVRQSDGDHQISADSISSHRVPFRTQVQHQIRKFHTQRLFSTRKSEPNVRNATAGAEPNQRSSSDTIEYIYPNIPMNHRAHIFREQGRPKFPEGLEEDLRVVESIPRGKGVQTFELILQDTVRAHPLAILHDMERSQEISTDYHLMFRIWMASFAMLLDHPVYTPEVVRPIFKMLPDIPNPPLWLHRVAIDAFLPAEGASFQGPPLDQESLALVFDSLAAYQTSKHAYDSTELFERFYLAKIKSAIDRSCGLVSLDLGADDVRQLFGTIGYKDGVCPSESFHLQALEFLAPNLDAFLAHWECIPIYSGSRTKAMYEAFFWGLGDFATPINVRKGLDEWIDFMGHENPPVLIEGGLAEAIEACLDTVDPELRITAERDVHGKNFYAVLWRKCQLSLASSP